MSVQDDTEDTLGDVQTLRKVADLKEGTRIHRYQILGLIGKGGMGAVYRAYDPELDRSIAIKILTVLPKEGETASRPQTRLMREAQALAKLSHPNVVAVHDVGTFEQGVYIAMEYVKGKTLREWIKEDKPTQKEIVRATLDAGRGLQAAHVEGIVHRDFKPDNVIVGDRGQVKVLDFGLARSAGAEEATAPHEITTSLHESSSGENLLSTPLTRVGAMVGTIVYMAPEHFQFRELDDKTDQFSFCVTLFEALYGKRPFTGKTTEELGQHIASGRIEIPPEASVPKWIEELLLKGLSVSKSDRYDSMAQLLNILEDDPEIAKTLRRKKQILVLAFILGAALSLGVGYVLFSRTSELCTGANRKLADVWNERQKLKLRQVFVKTGLSYADDSVVRVTKRLDDYLERWKHEYTETCESTRIRKEQSEEIMDLKMGCLHKHLRNANALVKVFDKADKRVVEKSVLAVSSLARISDCTDLDALRSRIQLPKDDKTKTKVATIREELAQVEALCRTGKYREGLVLAKKLEKLAAAIDYRPVQAEVLYSLGELFYRTGDYKAAETTLYDAGRAAGESRDNMLAAKAMALLVPVIGYRQARYDAGLSIAHDAEIVLGLGGGNESIKANLFNNLGILFYGKRDYDRALESYREALGIWKKSLGPEHPDVARVLNNIGVVFMNQGEHDMALKYLRKTYRIEEKELGPDHPKVAQALSNIGIVLHRQGKYAGALENQSKSLAIREKAFGSNHPNLVWTLTAIGCALVDQGKPNQAFVPLERVVAICEKNICDPRSLGPGLFALTRALVATDGDKQRALMLAHQAREIFGKTPKAFQMEIEELDAWLKKHGNRVESKSTFRAKVAEPKLPRQH